MFDKAIKFIYISYIIKNAFLFKTFKKSIS